MDQVIERSAANDRETLTVCETAKFLGIGRNQCYDAIREGRIPALRFGTRYVVPRARLEKMLEEAGG